MGFFGYTKRVLRREWGLIRKHPIYPSLMVVIPVVSFLFFVVLFSKGVPRDIPIAVVDRDQTTLSRQLISMIDATPTAYVTYEVSGVDEGEHLMKQGDIMAMVYIPRNFEKDILSNTQTRVAAYVSGMNITANGMLSKDIQTTVSTFSAGIQIQLLMKKGLSEAEAYAQMMPVSFDKHILFNPYLSYSYFLMPSFMPMMLLIFTLMLTIFVIGTELKNATAGAWMEAAGGRIWPALVGKMLPYTLCLWLLSLFMNTIMYSFMGVPLNGSTFIVLFAGCWLVLAYQSIAILIISVVANLRLSLSLGGGYGVLAFTFSGLTFPMMAMGPVVRLFCYLFPFTFYTEVFIDQALRGAPPVYAIQDLGWMSLFVFLPLLCVPRLKEVATNEKYWGRT